MVLQSRDAPLSVPDFEVVPIQELSRLLFGFLVVGAIQLVHAGDAPITIKDVSAVIHGSRSLKGTIIP